MGRHKCVLITFVIHFGVVGTLLLIVLAFETIFSNAVLFAAIKAHLVARTSIASALRLLRQKGSVITIDSFFFCRESSCKNREVTE